MSIEREKEKTHLVKEDPEAMLPTHTLMAI
jgi:hypothetical protein